MATLVLQAVGSVVGSAIGGPIGAVLGRALGGLAGAAADRALIGGGSERRTSRAPLRDIEVTTSTEGAPVPRLYGRARVGGEIIWATRVEAELVRETTTTTSGGKGGGGGGTTTTTVTESWRYYANLAIALCEGPVARIGRVWADGKPLDLAGVEMRRHLGGEAQEPDPLILAKEGPDAPAYRGVAYVVFERLALAPFGDRVPQFAFEVVRPVGRLERMLRNVSIIPGGGEFVYEPSVVTRRSGAAAAAPENRHTLFGGSDWTASIDELQALCPSLGKANLVVSWFGNDLSAAACESHPAVDAAVKETSGATWSVAGLARGAARVVSATAGRANFGGTPSDASVVRAIRDLRARGIAVTLYPFLMMDVPPGNARPDPWTGAAAQPAFPWRGRITVSPAPGRGGSPDGTAAAAAAVAAFFGTASRSHFALSGGAVVYAGPAEWRYRRMILHHAHLAVAAGGVAAIVIGSELVGLTRVRSGPGAYPAVAALRALAADVKAVVGPATRVIYAADWTEYGAHVLDGGAEVRFPLDPLFADPSIDAVGIDWYAPLADWREGDGHLDAMHAASPYDRRRLIANMAAGEAHDFHYASDADRAAQVRTPITDGLGKPWIFRQKDLAGWWSQPHVERLGGTELPAPTAWLPGMKPIVVVEAGCAAVDKGANRPNAFPDPRSSAGGLPPFSTGERDDLAQRRVAEAVIARFDPADPDHPPGANPLSAVYGGPMVDPADVALWAWDARPFPAFPLMTDAWSDGPAWQTGHWLTGRLGAAPLDGLIETLGAEAGVAVDAGGAHGTLDGYLVPATAPIRAAMEELAELFGLSVADRCGTLAVRSRGAPPVATFAEADLAVEGREAAPARLARAQASEVPAAYAVTFADVFDEFRSAAVTVRRQTDPSRGVVTLDLAAVSEPAEIERRARARLVAGSVGRESAQFALPPAALAVETGDALAVEIGGRLRRLEVDAIEEGPVRRITARAAAPDAPRVRRQEREPPRLPPPPAAAAPLAVVLDLDEPGEGAPALARLAVAADPWPGGFVLLREAGGLLNAEAEVALPARIGATLDVLAAGPAGRFDRGATVTVRMESGSLFGAPEAAVLEGANLLAVEAGGGDWEVLAFAEAELVAPGCWRLATLLRGLGGSERAALAPKPAGRRVVVLDRAVVPLARGEAALGRLSGYRLVPPGLDPAAPGVLAFAATPGPKALMPRAPVHLGARRVAEGVLLTWIRRTRLGGDGWDGLEVPLGESAEAYEIEVLAGGTAVRTLGSAVPQVLYPAADELADFGAPQGTLAVRVFQLSAVVGRGWPAEAAVRVG